MTAEQEPELIIPEQKFNGIVKRLNSRPQSTTYNEECILRETPKCPYWKDLIPVCGDCLHAKYTHDQIVKETCKTIGLNNSEGIRRITFAPLIIENAQVLIITSGEYQGSTTIDGPPAATFYKKQ